MKEFLMRIPRGFNFARQYFHVFWGDEAICTTRTGTIAFALTNPDGSPHHGWEAFRLACFVAQFQHEHAGDINYFAGWAHRNNGGVLRKRQSIVLIGGQKLTVTADYRDIFEPCLKHLLLQVTRQFLGSDDATAGVFPPGAFRRFELTFDQSLRSVVTDAA